MGLCSCHWVCSSEQNGYNPTLLGTYILIAVTDKNKYINNELSDNDMHHKENTAVTECGGLGDGMIIVNCVHGGDI